MSQFVSTANDSVYTVYVQLTDRRLYYGGDILAFKHDAIQSVAQSTDPTPMWTGRANPTDAGDLDKDEDDRAIADEMAESDAQQHAAKESRFHNAKTSAFERHTPDFGNMILVKSSFPHGVLPISRGTFKMLVMEFWPYADGDIGVTHRLTIDEAKPLAKKSPSSEL